jgi:adenylate cyclase
MSKENASAFLEAIRKDEALLKKYRAANTKRRLKIAEGMGFPHTAEDMKAAIQDTFGHCLSPTTAAQLVEQPELVQQLGGEERVLTAFFSDVVGFSTICQKLTPQQLIELFNEYLSAMGEIIEAHGGTIDKFEGDAIIAFYGAPIPHEDHAARACLAVLAMQEKLVEMREKWKREGKPLLHARMSINTGPMFVGNMGSKTRVDYTIMGDAVNLAARLEPGCKIYGVSTQIGETTYEGAKHVIEARELDRLIVVGRSEPVTTYEILSRKGELDAQKAEVTGLYCRGLELYRNRRWNEAISYFRHALQLDPQDGPSLTYIERCESYKITPPPDDWKGTFQQTREGRRGLEEATLERVRAEVASMTESYDLFKVVGVIEGLFRELGIKYDVIRISTVDEETGMVRLYGTDGLMVTYPLTHPGVSQVCTCWREGRAEHRLWTKTDAGQLTSGQIDIGCWTEEETKKALESWEGHGSIDVPFSHGTLAIHKREDREPLSEEVTRLLERFAEVISIAYPRFLDSQRLKEQHHRLSVELQMAHDVQVGLLPKVDPSIPGFEIAGTCIPANHVGGDHYTYLWLDEAKTKLAIIIADVSGHEMKAAMTVMRFSEILRYETRDRQSPAEILSGLNRGVYGRLERRLYVTACVGMIDPMERSVEIANAGHPPVYHRSGVNGRVVEVETYGFPLGVRPEADYQSTTVRLKPDDLLVFYTDGTYEAQDKEGHQYEFERLSRLIGSLGAGLSARELVDHIVADVERFTGSTQHEDDMTVVVMKVTGV